MCSQCNCSCPAGAQCKCAAFKSGVSKSWKDNPKEAPRTTTVTPVGRRGGKAVGKR